MEDGKMSDDASHLSAVLHLLADHLTSTKWSFGLAVAFFCPRKTSDNEKNVRRYPTPR